MQHKINQNGFHLPRTPNCWLKDCPSRSVSLCVPLLQRVTFQKIQEMSYPVVVHSACARLQLHLVEHAQKMMHLSPLAASYHARQQLTHLFVRQIGVHGHRPIFVREGRQYRQAFLFSRHACRCSLRRCCGLPRLNFASSSRLRHRCKQLFAQVKRAKGCV